MNVRPSGLSDSEAAPGATHKDMANAIRALAMDAVQKANSGHPGMPMGMADVATVLFSRFLKYQAERPDWPDRDRFVLSAGHGSMLLYALLYLTGYPGMTLEEVKNFRQVGARTAGHPEFGLAPGIETTTGPLGQGLANAVGMALAERLLNARFGDEAVDHRTFVIASDGDLMEGISHEAAALAGHLRLGRLVVFFDDNGISIDGAISLSDSVDQGQRFESYGWHVKTIDGHDPEAIARATEEALAEDRPSLIACRTTIGFGAPSKAGKASSHGAPLGEDEIAGAREALGWSHPPFEIPDPVLAAWRNAGEAGAPEATAWDQRLAALDPALAQAFEAAVKGELAEGWQAALADLKKSLAAEAPKVATRVSSQKVLEVLTETLPQLIGGSADLTGSNGTRTGAHKVVSAEDFSGNYLHYGIREHGMAGVMNGMALHGGLVPYGGSFLVFTDYCRPSIRLSALMEQRVVYVMTHDSIGLGEDGPTHQPVEHLAALRAIPNLRVFRPCDSIETAEAWELALSAPNTPSVLALSRQGLPTLRTETFAENHSAWGAYILAPAAEQRQVTLIASGSEVEIALEARKLLAEENIYAAVVSMPCWELFLEQPAHYRDEVLGPGLLRVAIEAAGAFGWHRWVGLDGTVIGMEGFGASGPAPELYQHFQITPKAVVERVKSWL